MSFTLEFSKPSFKFSCAHFTIFGHSRAEKLHGHNYRVAVQMRFLKLDKETGLAAEFSELKRPIIEVCDSLDEMVLIPNESSFLQINKHDSEYEVRFQKKRYVFPKQDVLLLPLRNISSEELARFIARELQKKYTRVPMKSLRVRVGETDGQSVTYQLSQSKDEI